MRRLSRTAVVFLALSGVACAVDRSGGGEAISSASAGSSPGGSVETGGSAGAAGDISIVGAAGVFGVATGNAGGASGASNQDHEGGTISVVDSGSVEPDHTGTVVAVDATVAVEASTPKDASSISSCALHPGGQTFTPSGAESAHCYWAHSTKSALAKRGRCLHGRRRTPRHRPVRRREHLRHQAHPQPRRQRSHLVGWHRQQDRHRRIGRRSLRLDHGRSLQLRALGHEQPRRQLHGHLRRKGSANASTACASDRTALSGTVGRLIRTSRFANRSPESLRAAT